MLGCGSTTAGGRLFRPRVAYVTSEGIDGHSFGLGASFTLNAGGKSNRPVSIMWQASSWPLLPVASVRRIAYLSVRCANSGKCSQICSPGVRVETG